MSTREIPQVESYHSNAGDIFVTVILCERDGNARRRRVSLGFEEHGGWEEKLGTSHAETLPRVRSGYACILSLDAKGLQIEMAFQQLVALLHTAP